MKHAFLLVTALAISLCIGATTSPHKRGSDLRFGEVNVSRSGVLSIDGHSEHYILVPDAKYPAELRGIALIDLDAKIYVARFFEPSGVGGEGFFDVCFRIIGKEITTALVQTSASLERIDENTYVRSCSYVYDSDKRVLLKTGFSESTPMKVSFSKRLKPTTNR